MYVSLCSLKYISDTETQNLRSQLHDIPLKMLQKVARYQCPLCTRVFRKAALRCHLRTHTQERPFVCSICSRGFGHRSSMITHVKQEHRGEAGYVCDVCPFTSANRASMERHRLIHTERKKPFLCAVCGASFFLK